MHTHTQNQNMSKSVSQKDDNSYYGSDDEAESKTSTSFEATSEYIHNSDYQQKMAHKEWVQDEKLKASIRAAEKKEKREKRLRAKQIREDKQKSAFNQKYEYAKAMMADGHSMSQALESIETMSPPKKKKAPSKKKSSTPAVQSNKLTSYFKSPSPTIKSSPPPEAVTKSSATMYPVFNTMPSDNIGNFRYPKAFNTPVSVTPISSMDRTSLYASNLLYKGELDDDGSGINMDQICRGCLNPYRHCMERKWRKVCLHSVMDFFEEHDHDGIQKEGVYKAYYNAFLMMIKAEIVRRSGYWECSKKLILPQCMKEGSLEEAYKMMNFEDDMTYEYCTCRRVYDVQRHLDRINGVFRGKCAEGEKIVRKREDLI